MLNKIDTFLEEEEFRLKTMDNPSRNNITRLHRLSELRKDIAMMKKNPSLLYRSIFDEAAAVPVEGPMLGKRLL